MLTPHFLCIVAVERRQNGTDSGEKMTRNLWIDRATATIVGVCPAFISLSCTARFFSNYRPHRRADDWELTGEGSSKYLFAR